MSAWKKLLVVTASLAGCAAPVATPESLIASGAPGIAVALAIQRIASAAAIADPLAIERELQLPGIAAGLSWSERPEDRGLGVLSATWTPGTSALGIVRVDLETMPRDFGDSHKVLTTLVLQLEPTQCPSEQVLHAALGVAPEFGKAPSAIGGSPTSYTSFNLTRDPRRNVRVLYTDENTCRLRVSLLEPRG
jgi:hypothetical protein